MKMDRLLLWSLGLGSLVGCGLAVLDRNLAEGDREPQSLIDRGREVYIAEGCLHCHSQYVRPVGPDQELWGPVTEPETALAQQPVLIGNRRQGPDLANVGMRRPPEWNRAHLIDPSSVSPRSRMPSYAHLFRPGNADGEALLVYLASLKPPNSE